MDGRPVKLLMEVGEGRVASAILGNGFLGHCVRLGATVNVLTPGAVFPPFVKRYEIEGTSFTPLSLDTRVIGKGRLVGWERRMGRRLTVRGLRRARRVLWEIVGARLAAGDVGAAASVVNGDRPDAFLATDVNMGFGRGLVGASQRRGIPTIGNIFSWDHPYYEHPSRPDRVTCWSPMVKGDLIRRSGFEPDRIDIIGAPIFDAYVDPDNAWTRAELCGRLGLDAGRPVLVYATLGQMRKYFDETGAFRALLEEIDAGRVPGRPQVVLRLHPLSVDHYFHEFKSRPDVVFSRFVGYSPGMRWWPSQDEVALAANLMRHADACLSPGSTMAIEPAIFDTPTIVPVFNQYMPREYGKFFKTYWLSRHFRFLAERELLPFVYSADEMRDAVCRALAERSWMREERRVIRDELFGPLDGRATERLAEVAVGVAAGGARRSPLSADGKPIGAGS